jgi:phosphate transport system substrate-binding protein
MKTEPIAGMGASESIKSRRYKEKKMYRKNRSFLVLMGLLVLTLLVTAVGCQPTPTAVPTEAAPEESVSEPTAAPAEPEAEGQISVAGSTTVQPLAEKLAEAFASVEPGVQIDVQGGGSSVGVKSAGQGQVDIGAASREVKESELEEYPDLQVFTIARDGIAIVVHPDVAVDGLTKDQVRDVFAGEIVNWSEVGGPDKSIVVVSREEGSGTRAAFEEMVIGEEGPVIVDTAILQPSNGAVRTTVSTTPDSIAFLSFGYLDSSTKALAVDGVLPTPENAANGTYPIVRPLNMMTKGEPSGVVKAWLDFVLSAEGQAIVVEEGYIAVK